MNLKRMVIIDGNSLINRAFYALPPLTNKEGQHTNAIYGFMTMLLKVMDDYDPQYISVAFDRKAPTFRHKSFEGYKAGRKKMPPELAEQLEPLKEVLDAFHIYRVEIDGFEADDLIGTLSKYAEEQDIECLIVTGDKDALQLASEKVKILFTKKGISSLEIYDPQKIMEQYEVTPEQFIDLKGLMGDNSDNIPGIPGVGEKTAIKLLKQFGTVENLIQNAGEISAQKLREKVENNTEQAMMSKRLATIMTNVPVEIELEKLKKIAIDEEKVLALFKKFEFNTLIGRVIARKEEVDGEVVVKQEKMTNEIAQITNIDELKKAFDEVRAGKQMILQTKTEEENIVLDHILAITFSVNGEKLYYIDVRDFSDKEALLIQIKEVLEDEEIHKIGHDIKHEIRHFYVHDIEMKNVTFDTMIGEYLIDPAKSSYALKDLAAQYIGQEVMSEEELRGKGKNLISIGEAPKEDLMKYLCQRVSVIGKIYPEIKAKMQELELEKLYYEVELPLVEVLAAMEYKGIKVDRSMLEILEIEFGEQIDLLTKAIHELAETNFNINSPKQLGEVLFEKLELPPIKKTKTGYSTNAEVLEKLQDQHDIIPKILEYRQVTKLKSTYVDGLLNIINPETGRIHSNFNQTVTTTGRISSTEPNLQNIPIKLEMGRRLRKVFVANENHQFIDADYSQVELRVLAHICEDENLLDAFLKNQDIHTRTAAEIFDVPMEEVTDSMRSSAKAVNFGIVYGISDYGLSQNLNITRVKAKKYIDNYLDKYPSVKRYMDEIVEQAHQQGYVVTLFNRRRYLPELKSRNFNIRSFGERMAMNTPIQGSAADIIKIAMVNVYRRLKEQGLTSKLILQVHDELIVEAPDNEVEVAIKIVRESMEEAMNLKVQLKVDLAYANNWYDAK
ncbi:DNA polymerase I [Alkaliphilus metalliredigens QYMF]|uniref:DNA polymerase I n=1 Tax=Alkaliphilus metalliredigens (strain QYMF) TaxID=293826 RepID=A6TSU6_ALKMQ|nr:DNA polymerase I [Alkaliphilus metalliredigens]ABR49264.1 DNA polymerase I [Alkaliphilus metalliredigens QYMF]